MKTSKTKGDFLRCPECKHEKIEQPKETERKTKTVTS
jgi:predicted Zn-ribbon and HTH transcriptional regulator